MDYKHCAYYHSWYYFTDLEQWHNDKLICLLLLSGFKFLTFLQNNSRNNYE